MSAKLKLNRMGEIPEHSHHSDPNYVIPMKRQKEIHRMMVDWLPTAHTVVAGWDLTAGTVNLHKSIQFQGTSLSPWEL